METKEIKMPAFLAPLAISGISALAGLLGNRKKTATQESTTNSSSTQNVDLYNNPILSDEAASGYGVGINNLINQVNKGTDFRGYAASGVRNINRQSEIKNKLLQRTLAQRGLSYSPAGAAIEARAADETAGQTFDFLNSIPMLQRQMQGEDINSLIRAAASMPVGSRQTGTTTQTGTSTTKGTATQPGDMLGGLFSGLGQGIASTVGYNWSMQDLMKRYPGLLPGAATSSPRGAK